MECLFPDGCSLIPKPAGLQTGGAGFGAAGVENGWFWEKGERRDLVADVD